METDDPFTRELRASRDRIADLQRRSDGQGRRGGRLLFEALAELSQAIEELSVTGEELQEQTGELTATRAALESERERYQELFEFAPFAYLITDPTGKIVEANRTAAALLGAERRFLVGKSLVAYVHSEDRWGFRSMVNRLRRGDEDRVVDRMVRIRRRGGTGLPCSITVDPVSDRDGGVRTLRWLLRTPEPQALVGGNLPVERALEQDSARRRHLETLATLDPVEDLDGTVQILLDAGVRLLAVDGIGLMLADDQGRPCAAGGTDEATLSFVRAQDHLMKGPCVHAFLLERVVHSSSLAGDPRWPQLAEAAEVNLVGAALAAPIGLYGGPIGACLLVSAGSRSWSDADITAAEAYTTVLAGLLELAAEAQHSSRLARQLQRAFEGQAVVEQAKGALMAEGGIDAAAATLQLRELARRSGSTLAEVAQSVLQRLGGVPPAQ